MYTADQGKIMQAHELVSTLMKKTPHNKLGLPEGIYRPDLLPSPSLLFTPSIPHEDDRPSSLLSGESSDGSNLPAPLSSNSLSSSQDIVAHPEVRTAYTPLCYVEGYPTYNGMPFWSQLPFEPPEAYAAFQAYLSQGKQGARQLYLVPDSENLPYEVSDEDVHEWFDLFYWASRSRAHDMFKAAHRRREREMRVMDSEDSHFLMAERLLNIATAYLDEQEEELIELMSPKDLLEFVKTASQLQRVSLGLPGNGPASKEPQSSTGVAPMEIIMRQVAQESHIGDSSDDSEQQNRSEANKQKLQQVLRNPEALKNAQELILRLGAPQQQSTERTVPEMDTL